MSAYDRDCDEFTCTDCGQFIVSIPAVDPPPTRCATCLHLEEFVSDSKERENLRRRMMGGGTDHADRDRHG